MTALPQLPQFPLLPGLYHVVVLGADRVLIANAGRSVVLSGEGFAERVAPLLACLDGNTSLDELESKFGSWAADVVAGLAGRGLVSQAGAGGGPGLVAAKLSAVALAGAGPIGEVAARIAGSTVAVAGCGPVTATAALLLAKAGLGRLLLADPGEACSTSLVVSPFATTPDEARSVDALADACRQAGSAAGPIDQPLGEEVLAEVDLVIVEHGYGSRDELAEVCLRSRVPYLVFAQDALEASIGPLVVPGGRPCHRCATSRQLSHKEHLDEHLAYRRHRAAAAPGPDSFLAAHVAVLGGLVATECLRALTGMQPVTDGGVLVVSLGETLLEREELLPIPGCSGCDADFVGSESGRDG